LKWKGNTSNGSTIDNLSTRLNRLEAADEPDNFSDTEYRYGLTEEEYEKLTSTEKYELRFSWYVKNIMPYYKAEVMQVHNLTSEEYDRRTLEGDQSIYLPQPNKKFQPTLYIYRVAAVLGLNYQQLRDKIAKGEVADRIATGDFGFRDEDSNAVF
jgi:hypothetical protein